MALQHKRVVIIGGSSGIGLATARTVLEQRADVVIAGRSAQKLEQARAALGGSVETLTVDVTREQAVREFFEHVGQLDHLVLTVGSGAAGSFQQLTIPAARSHFDGKFWGQYYAARYAAPRMNHGGSIVFFAGVASQKPMPGYAITAAANGALEALCRTLAVELAPLRVNCVSPGLVDTPAYAGVPDDQRAAFFSSAGASLPVRRVGQPDDLAQSALFLMTNGFTTGTILYIDGGRRLV